MYRSTKGLKRKHAEFVGIVRNDMQGQVVQTSYNSVYTRCCKTTQQQVTSSSKFCLSVAVARSSLQNCLNPSVLRKPLEPTSSMMVVWWELAQALARSRYRWTFLSAASVMLVSKGPVSPTRWMVEVLQMTMSRSVGAMSWEKMYTLLAW